VRLYDLLDPTRFTLLLMAGPHPSEQKRAAIWKLARHIAGFRDHCRLLLILGRQHADGFSEFPGDVLLDPTQFLHHQFGVENGAAYLIRPDSYVAFSHHELSTEKLEPFLARYFPNIFGASPLPSL